MEHNDSPPMLEESIRPASLMDEKKRHLEWDVEFLVARKDSWVEVACPACGSAQFSPYGEKRGFAYRECVDCQTIYTSPRPSQELLHEFYACSRNYDFWNRYIFPQTEAVRRERIFRPRAERTAAYAQQNGIRDGAILEVGAAYGWYCEEMKNLSLFRRIVAVEPAAGLAETCRRKGIETLEMPIERVPIDSPFDVVAAFEVIEHLFSPREFVAHCARLLRNTGLLILTCPNARGFDVGTLGLKSSTFDHEHLNYFNTQSLPRMLAECGFTTLRVETPGQLDVDIVRKRYRDGDLDLSGNFLLAELLERDREEDLVDFQQFLATHLLSSHMWVVARKSGDS